MIEESTEIPVATAAPEEPPRLFFIDNLRTALICLVVLHHLAVVYGAGAVFYYLEPPVNDPLAYLVFIIFILLNQSYFMGLLFLLSGYFSPGSYDRKGTKSFVTDRVIRLGIPLLIFMFILGPLASIGFWQIPTSITGLTTPLTWNMYPALIAVGPLWFIEMLLFFNFGYTLWRWATKKRLPKSSGLPAAPRYRDIVIFVIVLAGLSYLLRMVVPLGYTVPVLGFPTFAYLPQYLSFFILGTMAFRLNWFKTIPDSMGIIGLGTAIVVAVFLLPLALTGHFFSLELTSVTKNFTGLGHWQSAVYALWDSIFSVGICLALITLFRRFLNIQGTILRIMSQHSYAVYLVHSPVIVFLALAVRWIDIEHLLKFALAAVLAFPICFALAFAVRKIPFLSKIL